MAEQKEVLTTRDLKEMFGVSRSTLFAWRKKGLEFFNIPGNGLSDPVRYRLEDVRRFAQDNGKTILVEIF